MQPGTTFKVDEKLSRVLGDLQRHYGAASKAAVLRKAVALLSLVREAEQADGSIVVKAPGSRVTRIVVRSRKP
jgi:hypothetical protein